MFNIKVLFKFKTINYLASISLNTPSTLSTTVVVTSDTSNISKYTIMYLMLLSYLICDGV